MRKTVRIGSRGSSLALRQSEIVRQWILKKHPELDVQVIPIRTRGDERQDLPLEGPGSEGLFVGELEQALLEGRTDLSVHSLKDVPSRIPSDLPLIAFSGREDARDVLLLPFGKTEPDLSEPIGCSSKRRMLQFQALYPDAHFAPIRGNVETRIRKVDEGRYTGTILAAAGLLRLGLKDRITRYFSIEEMIPAAGQGILAVQGRAGEEYSYLEGFSDPQSECAAKAERAFLSAVGGDCSVPSGAFARIRDGKLQLTALYCEEKTGRILRGTKCGDAARAGQIGRDLAESLLRGAGEREV